MNVMINDAVFGEMTYTHRWSKKESFSFFEKIEISQLLQKLFLVNLFQRSSVLPING